MAPPLRIRGITWAQHNAKQCRIVTCTEQGTMRSVQWWGKQKHVLLTGKNLRHMLSLQLWSCESFAHVDTRCLSLSTPSSRLRCSLAAEVSCLCAFLGQGRSTWCHVQKRARPYITYEDRNRSQQTVKGLRMYRSVRPVFQQPHPFPIVPHLLLDLRISPLESENLVVRAVRGFGREGGPYSQVTAAPRSAAALHGWSVMPAKA